MILKDWEIAIAVNRRLGKVIPIHGDYMLVDTTNTFINQNPCAPRGNNCV